jgi:hypothetical protein
VTAISPNIFNHLQVALTLLICTACGNDPMLITSRASEDGLVFAVSGRLEAEDITELQRLFGREGANRHITLDLRDVTLVSRDVVKFLAECEAKKVELKNCPGYVREWIAADRPPGGSHSKSAKS